MGKSDLSSTIDRKSVCKKVWTFEIRGGESFDILISNNPTLHHTGGLTLWKLVGTQRLAQTTQKMLEELGATVRWYTEGESKEQKAERKGRLPSR